MTALHPEQIFYHEQTIVPEKAAYDQILSKRIENMASGSSLEAAKGYAYIEISNNHIYVVVGGREGMRLYNMADYKSRVEWGTPLAVYCQKDHGQQQQLGQPRSPQPSRRVEMLTPMLSTHAHPISDQHVLLVMMLHSIAANLF